MVLNTWQNVAEGAIYLRSLYTTVRLASSVQRVESSPGGCLKYTQQYSQAQLGVNWFIIRLGVVLGSFGVPPSFYVYAVVG